MTEAPKPTRPDPSTPETSNSQAAATRAVTNAPLSEIDPDIAAVLRNELGRQRGTLEMIASENFAPRAGLQGQGSVLTNKYAEGYPGKRYYGGREFVATRSFDEAPFGEVADRVAAALQPSSDLDALRGRVHSLAERLPLYEGMESR